MVLYLYLCVLCSVAVLVHNTSRNVFIFVRQFRPGKLLCVLHVIHLSLWNLTLPRVFSQLL